MAIAGSIIAQIRTEWQAAPQGSKSLVIERWAGALQCSSQTIYRRLDAGRSRKSGEYRIEGIKDAAMIVAQIKKKPPKEAGEISTDQAIELAVSNGCIPAELQAVSVATFNRVIRDCGLSDRAKRVQRYQAEYPNQLHHVDASSSAFFYVARELEGGDCVLKLNRRPSSGGYKNKPAPTRLRPWLYGLTDDYSGYHIARYVAALGESLADNLQFLAWAWGSGESGDEKPFFGLPERIKADQGPLMKGEASREWLDRLGIEPDGSVPYEKDAHGKVERPWRTLWGRFEKPYYMEDAKTFEITLSEINHRFRIYQDEEYNLRSHRYERDITRLDAWRRISARGGAVAMPANAIATAARRYERTVGDDGCLSLDGITYEVKEIYGVRVRVYEGIFEDKIVVEDMKTGRKYEAKRFAPTPLDTYVGHKETEHAKAWKTAQALELRNTLYVERKEEGDGKVVCMPTRAREVRAVENPLDIDTFSSIEAAMREFYSICPLSLDADSRAEVRGLIIENGLSRNFVRELALDVLKADEGREENYG